MTVAAAVAAVTPAGREEKHGDCRETIDADAAAAAACHHRETSVAAVAAAAGCHRCKTSVAAAAAAAACHCRETSVAAATAGAEACHRREIRYRRPFVGLRTSYTTLSCLLLLELAALQSNPHAALQSSPQIALVSLPSVHSHLPYLKLLSLTQTPGFMPPARQDLRHTYANGIYATRV